LNDPAILRDKTLLREQMLAHRAEVSPTDRAAAAEAVAAIFFQNVDVKPGVIVAGFYSVGYEFDCMPLLTRAKDAGARLALPRIMPKRRLAFLSWRPGDEMAIGPLDIPYPASGDEVQPDIVVTPLLAFDADGRRLGYGGGYYDRAIARLRALKPVVAVGVAQAWQQVDELPVEEHDHQSRLDMIITENGVAAQGAA
jgi:5-formyltetrahydrofolate cyclo-ligase